MEILTKAQRALNLILQYWDNPNNILLQGTLVKIQKHYSKGSSFPEDTWGIFYLT